MANLFHIVKLQFNAWTYKLVTLFVSPRDVAKQHLKGLDKKIVQCTEGLINIRAQYVLLENKQEKYMGDILDLQDKIKLAMKSSEEELAQAAGAEILKKQRLIENLDYQLNRLKPIIDRTQQRIIQYNDQKLELETHIEVLATQLTVAQTEQQLATLISGPSGTNNVIGELETETNYQNAKAIATTETYEQLSEKSLDNKFLQLENINNQQKIKDIIDSVVNEKPILQIERK